jgi:hypothetical protein
MRYIEIRGGGLTCRRLELTHFERWLIGDFTRENIERWLHHRPGTDWVGVAPVQDFHAVCDDIDIGWATSGGLLKRAPTASRGETCETVREGVGSDCYQR